MKKFTQMPALAAVALVAAVVAAPVAIAQKSDKKGSAKSSTPNKPRKSHKRTAKSRKHGGDRFKHLTSKERKAISKEAEAMHERFIKSLAGKLGVTPEKLENAMEETFKEEMEETLKEQLQQAVSEGEITQEKADRLLQHLKSGYHHSHDRRFKGNHRGVMPHHPDGPGFDVPTPAPPPVP